MTLLLAVLLAASNPEAELLEDDVTLPVEYSWDDLLAEFKANPLDLNTATAPDLLRIPFLSPDLARRIVARRQTQGRFRDVAELVLLEGADSALVDRVRPYLRIGQREPASSGNAMVRAGAKDVMHGGVFSGMALAERVGFEVSGLSFALNAAKDAGEGDALDFLAGGISYRFAQTGLYAGDYDVRSGQGLVFSRLSSYWFTTGVMGSPKRQAVALGRTFAENLLLRGLAVKHTLGPLSAELFVSRSQLDAVPNPDSSINHISFGGLHDDSSVQANHDRLGEDLAGLRVGARTGGLACALTGYANRYALPVRSDSGGFQGNSLVLTSADLTWIVPNQVLGLEIARSWNHGWAGAFDLRADWDRLSVHLDLDYLQEDFYSPHSRSRSLQRAHDALAASFRTGYELGRWLIGLYATTSRDFVLDSMPARIELSIESKRSDWHCGLRWKQSFKDQFTRTAGTRLDAGYQFKSGLNFDARLEERFLMSELGHRGLMFSLGAGLERKRFSLESRVSLFRVNDADCRVYAYESGFPGNNVSFATDGWRVYAAGGVRAVKSLQLRAKVGFTRAAVQALDCGLSLDAKL